MVNSSARPATWLFVAGCALGLACWLTLWRFYPLSSLETLGQFQLRNTPGHFGAPKVRLTALLMFAMWATYALGCFCVWRRARAKAPVTRAMALAAGVFVVGVAVGAARLYPFASIDIFYYMCQLKLHYFYGANPYVVPFAPRYAADPFAAYSGFTRVTCAYGPAWFWLSWPVAVLAGFGSLGATLLGYKIWSALWVILCGALIFWGTKSQRPWLSVALFVGCPLVWFDAVGNGHNDIMMAAFLLGAVLLAQKPNAKIAWLALPLLAVAIMAKPSAAALAWIFLVWMRRIGWTPRALLISGGAGALVAMIIVAPFWQSGALAGWRAGVEFSLSPFTSSPISLAREFLFNKKAPAATQHLVRPIGMALLILITLASPYFVRRFEHNLALVLGLTYLLAGSLFSWYLLPIIALLALRLDRRGALYIVLASLPALLYSSLETWANYNSPLAGHGIQVNAFLAVCLAAPLLLWILSALGRPQTRAQTAR